MGNYADALAFEKEMSFWDIILDYADFMVAHSRKSHRYYYFGRGENIPVPVELIAALPTGDVLADDETLISMFDCLACGEHIDSEGKSQYLWFR